MVKTRHNADNDDEAYDEFISLASRRTRSKQEFQPQVNGYHGGSEGESDDIQEQPQPSRRTRGGQRNISIFAGNTTDDETPPRTTRRKRYREIQNNRAEQVLGSGRSHREPRPQEEFMEEHVEENGCRRSTRQRKLVYDTFNTSLINKQLAFYSPEHNIYEDDDKPLKKRRYEVEPRPEDEGVDMYTRVKRERLQTKRNMYGVPIIEDDNKEEEEETDSSDDEEEEEEESEEEEQSNSRQYFLREHKPRTKIYEAPIEPKRSRPTNIFRESTPPRSIRSRHTETYSSPARRKNVRMRRKAAFHRSSSTSSSSSTDSDGSDERRFERRKAKSMNKSRTRCLPMNMAPEDMAAGFIRERTKIGSSLADVDPMNIDRSITFESVGGLGKHVRALKEMVVFPLLYPEVFEKFKITPPRGCLFYGPPGTGKTLVARALANECSSGERRVSFFMRKGADCLSKWVGESERQLRLLFDQAYQMRPSIIFFDEIDGLAPVRSSRQDQIHSSIVSTLLALMDGLDNRGEIVIIGATNRIDSIDPALRRPGRFDREFAFPLPSLQARAKILQIHTKDWKPKLSQPFLLELAEKCAGYCGADLKALCTEACLHALRRRYPQIYNSQDKLQLDVNAIQLSASDFQKATLVIVPTAQRSATSPARALSLAIQPLLQAMLNQALDILRKIYPVVLSHTTSVDMPDTGTNGAEEDLYTDEDEDGPDIFEHPHKGRGRKRLDIENSFSGPFIDQARNVSLYAATHRPRLLLVGDEGQGQTTHLAPSIMHHMERLPVHVLDLPALYSVSTRTPEEACAQIIREARRTCPSIIYLPHIGQWWEVIGDATRATFLTLLQDLDPTLPLLFLATNDEQYSFLPDILRRLFSTSAGEVMVLRNPSENERRKYFEDLLLKQSIKPPPTHKQAAKRVLEDLPRAAPPEPRQLTATELKKLQAQEEITLRELRLFLREILNKLGRDRKFAIFTKPVDEEEVPDYYDVIANPIDLSMMMNKIDLHHYQTGKEFMDDIELIVSNCLEYNPDKNPADRAIRHRACTLKDTAQAMLTAELDEDFEKLCEEIKDSKKLRGEKSSATVPSYYFTKPLGKGMKNLLEKSPEPTPSSTPHPYNTRERGDVFNNDNIDDEVVPKIRMIVKKVLWKRSITKGGGSKSPWCKPTKRRYKKIIVYLDEFGNEIPQDNDGENKDDEHEDDKQEQEVESAEIDNTNKPMDLEEAKEADKENINDNDCELSVDTKELSRSPRGRRRGDSPRMRSPIVEPSTHSPRDRSKSDERVKSPDEKSKSREMNEENSPSETSSRTRRSRTFSGNQSEPEPMDVKITSPDCKCEEKAKNPEKTISPGKQSGENDAKSNIHEKDDNNKETSPVMRVTRSQMQPATRQRAIEILKESTQIINVDQDQLQQLLDKTVAKTEGCNIDELERLYGIMSQCICQHRLYYEKFQLLQDLEATLSRFR